MNCLVVIKVDLSFSPYGEPASFFSVSEEHSVLLPRRLLVFINPVAGPQKGKGLFEKVVQKMFDLAEIQYDVKYTGEYACSGAVTWCFVPGDMLICSWGRKG